MESEKHIPPSRTNEDSLSNDWIGIFDHPHASDSQIRQKKIERFASLLCTNGEGTLHVNNEKIHLRKNDLLICQPGTLIDSYSSTDDFAFCGFYFSKKFLNAFNSIPANLWNVHVYLEQHPLIHLSPEAGSIYCQYYELIRSKLYAQQPVKNHRIVTGFLLQAFLYEFHDTLENHIETTPVKFTSGDTLFNRFAELVLQSYPKPRSVMWYADKLNVSPKYLSAVCKQAGGETASSIINRYVVKDIKRLLARPEKSVKEIVVELEFPSISFFGKYVKKHLGVSPKLYRKGLCM